MDKEHRVKLDAGIFKSRIKKLQKWEKETSKLRLEIEARRSALNAKVPFEAKDL